VNWLLVLVTGLLVLVIAFFVIAEYSLLRSRHSRLELASDLDRWVATTARRAEVRLIVC